MKALIYLLLLISTTASANCYVRISTNLSKEVVNSRPTDLQKYITDDKAGYKCVMRYRIHVNDQWETVEGEGIGDTESEACVQAIRPTKAQVLKEIELDKITAETQVVCSDKETIQVRAVQVGEQVWESETDIHILPAERLNFVYKGTTCRWFVERNAQRQNMILYQGVICKVNNQSSSSKWIVVDKF